MTVNAEEISNERAAKPRRETYAEVEGTIVAAVLRGARVCAVLYGHPGLCARPGHRAVAQVRAAGLPARMLPSVSALDCLVADLGHDPLRSGLQAYEATYFFVEFSTSPKGSSACSGQ